MKNAGIMKRLKAYLNMALKDGDFEKFVLRRYPNLIKETYYNLIYKNESNARIRYLERRWKEIENEYISSN